MKYLAAILAAAAGCMAANARQPVEMTAEDLITKVYGLLDRTCSKAEMMKAVRQTTGLVPQEDEYGVWLDTGDGYTIDYYGLTPEVSARASYDEGGSLTDYGYFFLFPYASGDRASANAAQADFSGTLLQEMLDMELGMEADTVSDALFEASGEYGDISVDVRLVEEHNTGDKSGRFILILSLIPDDPDTWTAGNGD